MDVDLKQLDALLTILGSHGVSRFKQGELEIDLRWGISMTEPIAEPTGDKEEAPTDEDMMYWSAD